MGGVGQAEEAAILVRCILIRAAFGGMEGDVGMLRNYASLWMARYGWGAASCFPLLSTCGRHTSGLAPIVLAPPTGVCFLLYRAAFRQPPVRRWRCSIVLSARVVTEARSLVSPAVAFAHALSPPHSIHLHPHPAFAHNHLW